MRGGTVARGCQSTVTSQRFATSLITWTPKPLSSAATVTVSCHWACHDLKGDLGKQQRSLGLATSAQVISSCSSWPRFLFQRASELSFMCASGYLGRGPLCDILQHPRVLALCVCCFKFGKLKISCKAPGVAAQRVIGQHHLSLLEALWSSLSRSVVLHFCFRIWVSVHDWPLQARAKRVQSRCNHSICFTEHSQ